MNQFLRLVCFLAGVCLVAASPSWGAGIAWIGGDPAGPQNVTIATNWNPAPSGDPANLDSWFINTDSTGNYPIFDGVGVTSLTIWDFMLGRSDNWGMTHPSTGPGYFKQTGGTLNINATFQLGQGNAGLMNTYEFAGGIINKAATGDSKVGTEGATSTMIMSNSAQFNQAGWGFYVGTDSGSVGTLTMTGGSSILNAAGPFITGRNGGKGTTTMTGGSYITVSNEFIIGVDPGSIGSLTIDNANITTTGGEFRVGQNGAQGTVTVGDNVNITVGNQFHIGQDSGTVGYLAMTGTGSKITASGEFDIGAWGGTGTFVLGAGNSFKANGWSSVGNGGNGNTHVSGMGILTTSGTITHTGPIFIGRSGGSGVWNQIGGSTIFNDRLWVGGDVNGTFQTSTATLNVSGNSLMSIRQLCPYGNAADRSKPYDPNYASTVNIGGGTIQVQYDTEGTNLYFISAKNSNQFNVYLMKDGLTLDTNNGNAAIRAPLQDGSTQPGGTAGGGLTKTGLGELTLRGNNTYTGPTTVATDILRIPGTTTLATTSISVAAGATLDLGRAANLTAPLSSLNLDSGSTLALNLTSSASGANAIVTSNLTNNSGLGFVLGAQGLTLDTTGTYTLISGYNNTTAGSANVTMNIRGYTPVVTVGNTTTTVSITGTLANETRTWWNLDPDFPNTWDVNHAQNWDNAGSGDYKFMELDNVIFNDAVPGAPTANKITMVGNLHPATVVFDNSTSSYEFVGTGSLTGIGTTVTKKGTNTVTFSNAGGVYYTGMTTLSGGSLNFNCGDLTLTGGITLDGGALGVMDNGFGTTTLTVASNLTGTDTGGAPNGLTKVGSGTLILQGTSNYAGPTKLQGGGVVQIKDLAQLGTSSDDPANLVLDDILHYTGPATTLTRGFTNGSNNGGLWIDNDVTWSNVAVNTGTWFFTKLGAGTWTINQNPTATASGFGHLKLEGGLTVVHGATLNTNDVWLGNMTKADLTMDSGASLSSNNNFNAGASDDGAPGSTVLTMDNASISTKSSFWIGHNNSLCSGTLTMTNGSKINDGWDFAAGTDGAQCKVSLSNGSSIVINGYGYVGENGGQMDLTLNDSSSMTFVNRLRLAAGGNNGLTTVAMHGTSSITSGNPGWESIALGRDGANKGYITMDGGNATLDRLSGSHILCGGPLEVGRWGNGAAYGEIDMSGASYITSTDYTLIGGSKSTGKLIMSQVSDLVSKNDFYLGSDGGQGTLTMSDAAHITVTNGVGLARYGQDGVAPTANITMSGASEFHAGSWVNLGTFANAQGNLTMKDGAWMELGTQHTDQWCNFSYDTGKATIDMSGGARMTVANKGISLGERTGSVGTITLHQSASLTVTSSRPTRTTTGTDNSDFDNGALLIGNQGGNGTITVLDGARVVGDGTDIQLGYSYDDWKTTAQMGSGVMNVIGSGAQVSTTGAGKIIIGNVGGLGIWNQVSGTTTTPNPVILGEYDIKHVMHPEWGVATAGTGVLTLQGGVFEAPQITTHSNAAITGTTGSIYFQGGTLRANAASDNFITSDGNGSKMSLLVGKGTNGFGAVIDTQAFAVTIHEAFVHDASVTTADGGLTKLGTGSLTLTADPTYNGNTTVDAGTLNVGNLNTPSATVYVANAATLNAVSIVADTLTIGGAPIVPAATAAVGTVPEPSTCVLLVLAGMGILLAARRRK